MSLFVYLTEASSEADCKYPLDKSFFIKNAQPIAFSS
jgi:hypothetical protein